MKKIDIYTDGACSDNGGEGIGGWACIITNGAKIKNISGGELHTTNNRMELKAVIEALKYCEKSLKLMNERALRIFSDSAYVVNGINKRWLKKWIANGWKTSKGTSVQNQDLWEIIDKYDKKINFQIIKVKGHSGDLINDECDKLAKLEVDKIKKGADDKC